MARDFDSVFTPSSCSSSLHTHPSPFLQLDTKHPVSPTLHLENLIFSQSLYHCSLMHRDTGDNWSASVPMTPSEAQDPRFQAWRRGPPWWRCWLLALALHCLYLWPRLEDSPAGDEVPGTSRQKAHFPCHGTDRVWTQRHENENQWANDFLLFHSKILSCLPVALWKPSTRVPATSTAWCKTDSPLFALNAGCVVNNSKCGRTCACCIWQHVCT